MEFNRLASASQRPGAGSLAVEGRSWRPVAEHTQTGSSGRPCWDGISEPTEEQAWQQQARPARGPRVSSPRRVAGLPTARGWHLRLVSVHGRHWVIAVLRGCLPETEPVSGGTRGISDEKRNVQFSPGSSTRENRFLPGQRNRSEPPCLSP